MKQELAARRAILEIPLAESVDCWRYRLRLANDCSLARSRTSAEVIANQCFDPKQNSVSLIAVTP